MLYTDIPYIKICRDNNCKICRDNNWVGISIPYMLIPTLTLCYCQRLVLVIFASATILPFIISIPAILVLSQFDIDKFARVIRRSVILDSRLWAVDFKYESFSHCSIWHCSIWHKLCLIWLISFALFVLEAMSRCQFSASLFTTFALVVILTPGVFGID